MTELHGPNTSGADLSGRADATVPALPRPNTARRFWYLFNGLFLAIPAFVVAVAGFSAGISTLVVWIGVPILAATFVACRGLAGVERRSTELAIGRPLPPHHYRPATADTWLGRALGRLRDAQSWRDLLHAFVAFPVRLALFCVAVTWVVGGLGATLGVVWMWSLPYDSDGGGLYWLIFGRTSLAGEIVLNFLLGLFMLATAPALLRGLVSVRSSLARGLLTNQSAALAARAVQLESSRRAAVAAEAQTLRRLERDIHDGPQQRLVRLNMDLEAVVRRLDDDPDRARALMGEALDQSREALTELRALSRGIAPPILADRGLEAALAASAARCPVDVALDVSLPKGARLAESVESTAYFVVTEALTNVAKHAAASRVDVEVRADSERIFVQVRDDGHGGAHLGKGHGLAGLADRLATVEGALDVHSPVGGPTVLTADIPLRGVGA